MHLFVLTKNDIVLIVDVVCLPQHDCTLNAIHCTFKNNNAENDGGSLYAQLGYCIQNLTVLENRIHHSNDAILYYKILELLLFLNDDSATLALEMSPCFSRMGSQL